MRSICLLLVTALALLSAPTQAADVIPQRAQPQTLRGHDQAPAA